MTVIKLKCMRSIFHEKIDKYNLDKYLRKRYNDDNIQHDVQFFEVTFNCV
jgi:hypothetical protein